MNYYVDAFDGDDALTGQTEKTAWKTIKNVLPALRGGDEVLFRRGGVYALDGTGKLLVSDTAWSAYGSGPRPILQMDDTAKTGLKTGLTVEGSGHFFDGLRFSLSNPRRDPSGIDPSGRGVKLGWYVGLNLNTTESIVANCEFDHLALGVYLRDESRGDSIIDCHFHDLDCLWRVDGAAGAMGALGVLLRGTNNVVSNNLFENNWAECVRKSDNTVQSYSAPVEFYNANNCRFEGNRAFNHRKNGEFGKDPLVTSSGNVYRDNLIVSNRPRARGPNIHSGSDIFGPVLNTLVTGNTILLTGPDSEALIVSQPGQNVYQNILVGQGKAMYMKLPCVERNNLCWGGKPQFVGGALSPTSQFVNPLLDVSGYPLTGSPAIGETWIGYYQEDDMAISIAQVRAKAQKIQTEIDAAKAVISNLNVSVTSLEAIKTDILALADELETFDRTISDAVQP